MSIFKFTGSSITEALKKAITKFGDEAIFVKSDFKEDEGIYEVSVEASDELVKAALKKEMQEQEKVKDGLQNKLNILEQLSVVQRFEGLFNRLAALGVNYFDIEELKSQILTNPEITETEILLLLDDVFKTAPLDLSTRRLMFVGASGVGKTSSCFKLALVLSLQAKMHVAIISLDFQKIGADLQIKELGNIGKIPTFSCYDREDFIAKLNELSNFDAVLIDTAGAGPKDLDEVAKLRQITEGVPMNVVLVLSAVSGFEDMCATSEVFSQFSPQSIFFTKFDEGARFGKVYSLLKRAQLPVSFCSVGKSEFDALVEATPEFLKRVVFNK